jgi:hypothetical protein
LARIASPSRERGIDEVLNSLRREQMIAEDVAEGQEIHRHIDHDYIARVSKLRDEAKRIVDEVLKDEE